jgi:5-methylcytosine-specific restriction endonuclease McrA
MDIDEDIKKTKRTRQLPKSVRLALWNNTFGECQGAGTCCCCGRIITQQTFEAGHVHAQSLGGSDTIDNLRPICGPCNRSMGNTCMDEFISKYGKM